MIIGWNIILSYSHKHILSLSLFYPLSRKHVLSLYLPFLYFADLRLISPSSQCLKLLKMFASLDSYRSSFGIDLSYVRCLITNKRWPQNWCMTVASNKSPQKTGTMWQVSGEWRDEQYSWSKIRRFVRFKVELIYPINSYELWLFENSKKGVLLEEYPLWEKKKLNRSTEYRLWELTKWAQVLLKVYQKYWGSYNKQVFIIFQGAFDSGTLSIRTHFFLI